MTELFSKTEDAKEFPADWKTTIMHKYVMKKKNENIQRIIISVATITNSMENTFRMLAGEIINCNFRSSFQSVCCKGKWNLEIFLQLKQLCKKSWTNVEFIYVYVPRSDWTQLAEKPYGFNWRGEWEYWNCVNLNVWKLKVKLVLWREKRKSLSSSN